MDSCIVCGSDKELDTELIITINNEKITVKVCKEHADDITPKAAKAAYLKRKSEHKSEMDDFLAQAAKLGMVVVQQGSIATVEKAKAAPVAPAAPVVPDAPVMNELKGGRNDGILSTSVVDNTMQRVSGIAGAGAERHNAYNPDDFGDRLPDGARDGLVKMELAEGRQGTPLAIPALRQDGLGTTRVRIAKSMTDADLQRRFKQMASTDHSFGQEGYDLHRCTMCKGEGQIQKSQAETIVCPKCGGSGLV